MSSTVDGFGRRAKLFALIAALALASSVIFAACGDDDDSGDSGGATAEGGEITISQTSQPDYLDPALTYTVNGIEPLWLVYTPLLTYPHVEGAGGCGADPGPRRGPPGDLRGRPHLHVAASRRTQVLRRHARWWPRTSSTRSSACSTSSPAGRPSTRSSTARPSTWRRAIPSGDITGIETDDESGEITITLTEADSLVLERARDVVRGHRPRRHAVQEPHRGPAPRRRSLHDHRVGAQPRVRDREEPRVRGAGHPGHPDPGDRQDHDADRQERQPAGAGRARRTSSTTCRTRPRRTSSRRCSSRRPTGTRSSRRHRRTTSS